MLVYGLMDWGGPAYGTNSLAVAMGFSDLEDLQEDGDRIARAIAAGRPLSVRDWTRALVAAEFALASEVLGTGGLPRPHAARTAPSGTWPARHPTGRSRRAGPPSRVAAGLTATPHPPPSSPSQQASPADPIRAVTIAVGAATIVYGSGAVPITKMIRSGISFDIIGAILILLLPLLVPVLGLG
jgi:hypothetical protein